MRGLEPPRPKALAPKASVSTDLVALPQDAVYAGWSAAGSLALGG